MLSSAVLLNSAFLLNLTFLPNQTKTRLFAHLMLFTKPNPYWLHQTHNKPNKIFGKFSKQTHTKPILNQAIPNQTKYLEILFGMGLIWFGKDFVWFGMGWFGLVKIQKNPIFFFKPNPWQTKQNFTQSKPNFYQTKTNQNFWKGTKPNQMHTKPNQTHTKPIQTKFYQTKPNIYQANFLPRLNQTHTKPNQISKNLVWFGKGLVWFGRNPNQTKPIPN